MSVMTIATLSLKSELLSQYRMPNALSIDVISSNDTLDSILFHCDLNDLGTSNSGIPHTVDGLAFNAYALSIKRTFAVKRILFIKCIIPCYPLL